MPKKTRSTPIASGTQPHFRIVEPESKTDGTTVWHKLGSAWVKDDNSISLSFHSHPVGRQVFLFPNDWEE